jgi:aspartate/methionine/tyrosine aminotransferase
MHFTPELTGVVESPMVQIASVAESKRGAVKLCYGESDRPTPPFICDAASRALGAGHTFYTHTAGCRELREAIAAKIHALHGVEYRGSEIIGTVGATAAIYTAVRAFVGHGDNAVVITPSYAIFANAVIMAGGEPRAVPLQRQRRRFHLDLERVARAIDAQTRMIIINSPSNPTGWVVSPDEQRALCELAERHDVVILADEVYERLVYDAALAPSFACVMPHKSRVVVVNSFSKTYNMTGWRLGWAQASEEIIRVMYKAAEFITSNPAAMVQQAGIVALAEGEDYVRDLRAHYAARRAQVQAALSNVPGIELCEPDGAFYAFFAVEGLTDSSTFTMQLLSETGLALTPGIAFGDAGEGYQRLCFAASEPTVSEGLRRLQHFLSQQTPSSHTAARPSRGEHAATDSRHGPAVSVERTD